MAATIGEELRIAREQRGISLREISDQTRISVHYLESIELDDYKRLPGGIFNRSFVKAYARSVGYDEKAAVEAYTKHMRERGEAGDDIPSLPHSKVYTDAKATRSPVLTVVLAIVILAIVTAIALAVMSWAQRRSTLVMPELPGVEVQLVDGLFADSSLKSPVHDLDGSKAGKTDYLQVLHS